MRLIRGLPAGSRLPARARLAVPVDLISRGETTNVACARSTGAPYSV